MVNMRLVWKRDEHNLVTCGSREKWPFHICLVRTYKTEAEKTTGQNGYGTQMLRPVHVHTMRDTMIVQLEGFVPRERFLDLCEFTNKINEC